MKLTDFRYEIEGLNIPDAPLKKRDSAKLMVLNRADQTIEHRSFSDIHEYLNEGDVLVYNNTKVFPARLNGKKEKTEATSPEVQDIEPEDIILDDELDEDSTSNVDIEDDLLEEEEDDSNPMEVIADVPKEEDES